MARRQTLPPGRYLTGAGHNIYKGGMPRRAPITDDEEATIEAALTAKPHASLIARESRGAWSYSTVWRVADRAGIPLTAGRETMGRERLSAEQRAGGDRSRPRKSTGDTNRDCTGYGCQPCE